MSCNFCFRVIHQQSADQDAEGVTLPFGSGVFGVAVMIQTAFITDADAVGIVAAGVGAGPLDRACGQDSAVTEDVKMIADTGHSTLTVGGSQGLLGKGTVLARGAAMYHNQVDETHVF